MKFIVTEDYEAMVAHCRARDKRLCFLAPRLRAGSGHRLDPYRPVPLPG